MPARSEGYWPKGKYPGPLRVTLADSWTAAIGGLSDHLIGTTLSGFVRGTVEWRRLLFLIAPRVTPELGLTGSERGRQQTRLISEEPPHCQARAGGRHRNEQRQRYQLDPFQDGQNYSPALQITTLQYRRDGGAATPQTDAQPSVTVLEFFGHSQIQLQTRAFKSGRPPKRPPTEAARYKNHR
jgi:hypothetical protein